MCVYSVLEMFLLANKWQELPSRSVSPFSLSLYIYISLPLYILSGLPIKFPLCSNKGLCNT